MFLPTLPLDLVWLERLDMAGGGGLNWLLRTATSEVEGPLDLSPESIRGLFGSVESSLPTFSLDGRLRATPGLCRSSVGGVLVGAAMAKLDPTVSVWGDRLVCSFLTGVVITETFEFLPSG